MKKFIAICLSAIMIIMLVPTLASAAPGAVTISKTEPTVIESNLYYDVKAYTNATDITPATVVVTGEDKLVTNIQGALNNDYLRAEIPSNTTTTYAMAEIDIDIYVPIAGNYNIEFVSHTPVAKFSRDNKLILDKGTANETTIFTISEENQAKTFTTSTGGETAFALTTADEIPLSAGN